MKLKILLIFTFISIVNVQAQFEKADTKFGLYFGEGSGFSLSASVSENDYLTMAFTRHENTMDVQLEDKYPQYINQNYGGIYGISLYWESHNYFKKFLFKLFIKSIIKNT